MYASIRGGMNGGLDVVGKFLELAVPKVWVCYILFRKHHFLRMLDIKLLVKSMYCWSRNGPFSGLLGNQVSSTTHLGDAACILGSASPAARPVARSLGNYPKNTGQIVPHTCTHFLHTVCPPHIFFSPISLLHFPLWASFFHKWCT